MTDYIVVGGGSAGCALAARLAEDRSLDVLLLEAGPRDRNPYIHMPAGFAKMTSGPLTWGLATAPQTHAKNREILALKYLKGHDYATLAALLGIPRGTVMSRLYHARKAFRKAFLEQTGSEGLQEGGQIHGEL